MKIRLIQYYSILSILVILIAFTGCKKKPIEEVKEVELYTSECDNSNIDGYKTLVQDDFSREYILYVPDSYQNNTSTPLLINFHGYGDCAGVYATLVGESFNLNTLADSENFIVVYPQAVIRSKGDEYWDPGNNGNQNINENDFYFTKQLINEIAAEYNIDLSRVYATGFSNGGMMSYDLACSGSDFIAAVGIMSGAMLLDSCDSEDFTSVILFHGIEDLVLPYNGNQHYQSIDETVNFWLDHNNIASSSLVQTEMNDGDVVKDEYTGGNENTSVVLYTIYNEFNEPGRHVWFKEEIDGNRPNKILWDFLSQYSLDD